MIERTKHLALFLSLLAAAGCSQGEGAGGPASGGATGTNPNHFTPGCSQAPACADCASCSEQCFCALQDTQKCADICSPPPGSSPTAVPTTSPTATPTTSPTPSPTTAPTTSPTPSPTTAPTTSPTGTAPDPTTTPTTEPPPPANTFEISTSKFDVPAGGEIYMCQNFKNPLGTDVAVTVTESFMAPGSHHMFVFNGASFDADSGTAVACSGTEFHDYVHVAQRPDVKIVYPAGIGRSVKGTEGFRILAHYLNTNTTTLSAQVTVRFTYVQPSAVQYLAAQMFLNQAFLSVPPGTSRKTSSFRVPYDIRMLNAVSHMHSRGTHFNASTNTGMTIYDGNDWDEPQATAYDPGLDIAAGSTITWYCDYDNPTAQTLTFGESAKTNEMCILNALFYPTNAAANQGVPLDSNF